MKIQLVMLWSDLLIYLLLTIVLFVILARRWQHWREPWRRVAQRKLGMIALVFLLVYSVVALLDSIHFKILTHGADNRFDSRQVISLLDVLLDPLSKENEETYSAPFSLYSSAKSTRVQGGRVQTYYPRLIYAAPYLKTPQEKGRDIFSKISTSILIGIAMSLLMVSFMVLFFAIKKRISPVLATKKIFTNDSGIAWREFILTLIFVTLVIAFIKGVSPYYHILGTNKIGEDILNETIKSIRTGLIIGTLTTLVMLPFAVLLGTEAGYFGGFRDDVIQYVYTTLSSVPAVLLISASVLSLQIFIANHGNLFPTLESRADARLLALCFILGITNWSSLCRLLRAETLKLREMDYVKAAVALGVNHLKIIWRHIIPNLMHIIIITIVLDFSALVLAEAVLSYVGVGVDPIMPSWGNMINSARLDLAREPVVWWPLFAAFIFMFALVLSANLFADAVRDAFDPRLRDEL